MSYFVIIVDDQREITRPMRAAIEALGIEFDVRDVLSGEEALLEARFEKFDLLITDSRLPGMPGMELITRMRKGNPALKVILITEGSDSSIQKEATDSGADIFFAKPIEIPVIANAVRQIFSLEEGQEIPDETPSETEDLPGEQSVSDRLAALRIELNAIAAALLDDQGQVLVQAGELPDMDFDSPLAKSLRSASSASKNIARFLELAIPENILVFNGIKNDLVASSVGEAHTLMVLLEPATARSQVKKVSKSIGKAGKDLCNILTSMGVSLIAGEDITPVTPPEPTPEDIKEEETLLEVDEELETLFEHLEEKLVTTDLDSFWEPSEGHFGDLGSSDALTYEQAAQLGLAPKDE